MKKVESPIIETTSLSLSESSKAFFNANPNDTLAPIHSTVSVTLKLSAKV